MIESDGYDWFYQAVIQETSNLLQDFEMFVAIHCYTFFRELFLIWKIDISWNKCKDNVWNFRKYIQELLNLYLKTFSKTNTAQVLSCSDFVPFYLKSKIRVDSSQCNENATLLSYKFRSCQHMMTNWTYIARPLKLGQGV